MNSARLLRLGLGALGIFVMAGVALGGASAMAVPSPSGPVAGLSHGAAAPTVIPSCTVSSVLYASVPVATVNEVVAFSTFVNYHIANHGACATVTGFSYTNLPAGPFASPGLTCASASTPFLTCGVGNFGVFDVTVTVSLSNGMTASASTWVTVNTPSGSA